MTEKLDFHTINEQFLNMGAVNSPSQLQGLLCGRMCGGQQLAEDQWREVAIEFLDVDHLELDEEQYALIQLVREQTEQLMDDIEFRFTPLLPDDSASLMRRTQELAAWCEGFLHGVGTSGLAGDAKLSAEVADMLRDLAQISQVSVEDEDPADENEAYWIELVEYVKVAVLNVYAELSHKTPMKPSSNTVH